MGKEEQGQPAPWNRICCLSCLAFLAVWRLAHSAAHSQEGRRQSRDSADDVQPMLTSMPAVKFSYISPVAATPAMGKPLAMPLANSSMSGRHSAKCSWPHHLPVRPTPDWTCREAADMLLSSGKAYAGHQTVGLKQPGSLALRAELAAWKVTSANVGSDNIPCPVDSLTMGRPCQGLALPSFPAISAAGCRVEDRGTAS